MDISDILIDRLSMRAGQGVPRTGLNPQIQAMLQVILLGQSKFCVCLNRITKDI